MRPGVFVYCRWPRGLDVPVAKVVAVVGEDDGFTVIMSEARAKRLQLVPLVRCRWISLGPKSASDGVGLTAGAAAALADVGIACNLIAALDHDHLFVPVRHSASDVAPAGLCACRKGCRSGTADDLPGYQAGLIDAASRQARCRSQLPCTSAGLESPTL